LHALFADIEWLAPISDNAKAEMQMFRPRARILCAEPGKPADHACQRRP